MRRKVFLAVVVLLLSAMLIMQVIAVEKHQSYFSKRYSYLSKKVNPNTITGNVVFTTPNTGDLIVNSNPSGATVYYGSIWKGYTPYTFTGLGMGNHQITLSKTGYQGYSDIIYITGGITTYLNVTLSTAYQGPYGLNITTDPAGAEVYIGDILRGTSPLFVQLNPGIYDIWITKPGYNDYTRLQYYFQSVSSQPVINLAIPLVASGKIYVISSPSQSEVYLNQVLKGMTPLTISGVADGQYTVLIRKPNYQDVTRTVTLSGGNLIQLTDISLSPLNPSSGNLWLTVSSIPAGARVYVDGVFKGSTAITVTGLTSGNHAVRLTMPGYQTYETTMAISDEAFGNSIMKTLVPDQNQTFDLSITTNPTYANIYIDGVLKASSPATIKVSAGNHEFRIEKAGYATLTTTRNMPNQAYQLSFQLAMANSQTGSLRIASGPAGAKVYIDSSYLGDAGAIETPVTFNGISVGDRELKVTYPGYQDYVKEVYIYPDQIAYVVASLVADTNKTGTLYVSSIPNNAEFYLNSAYKGKTPLTLEALAPGTYQARLTLPHYKPYTSTVEIRAGEQARIELARLELLTPPNQINQTNQTNQTPPSNVATLIIFAQPALARVFIDNVGQGTVPSVNTPLRMENVAVGSHELKLSKQGHEDLVMQITLAAGETKELHLQLTPNAPPGQDTGILQVSSTPSGAWVHVDNTRGGPLYVRGTTPLTITDLRTGYHVVKVNKQGFFDHTATVLIDASNLTELAAVLTPLPSEGNVTTRVYVSSIPRNAEVFIDTASVSVGNTPLRLENMAAGTYTFKLTMAGFQDFITQRQVSEGSSTLISAKLVPIKKVGTEDFTCTDTDNGNTPDLKGTITQHSKILNFTSTFTDFCSPLHNGILFEYACPSSAFAIDCTDPASGWTHCYDGACAAGKSDRCTDSDGGNTPQTVGAVTGMLNNQEYSQQDTCQSSTTLREYQCSGTRMVEALVSCNDPTQSWNQCSAGKCI
ncbi:MAG: PEGA domain-containing protein [Nanoarchaeota archaeon]